jgi:hypothetical protein
MLGGGGGGPPAPPPFHPMDINKIADKALSQDIRRYQDMGFPVFPGLSSVRQAEIEDAYKQLTSPLNPEFQSEFMKNATLTSRGAVGGGDPFSAMGMQKGSFSSGSQSATFAKQALAKQDYDRARMESLIQQNPVPGLGLSQQDLLSMYVYNTGAQNQWAMGNYANQVAGANADYQNQVNTWNTIGNTIGSLGSIYGQFGGFGGFGGGGSDMAAGGGWGGGGY